MTPKRRDASLDRLRVAQLAARFLVEGTASNFGVAKRKAATAMSAAGCELPNNLMLLAALIEYQQIFARDSSRLRNEHLRRAALGAMRFLHAFAPRLHGAVLFGTTLPATPVGLHLFEDETEKLTRYLLDLRIPFHLRETPSSAARGRERYPIFEICREDVDFELTVLPRIRLRQAIVSPLDGAPYRYLDSESLDALLQRDAGGIYLAGLEFGLTRYGTP